MLVSQFLWYFLLPALLGEEEVTEIQRKRHSALDVSFKGRVRKVAKMVDVSDDDTDDYSPCKFPGNDMVIVSCF